MKHLDDRLTKILLVASVFFFLSLFSVFNVSYSVFIIFYLFVDLPFIDCGPKCQEGENKWYYSGNTFVCSKLMSAEDIIGCVPTIAETMYETSNKDGHTSTNTVFL